ncbi:MAG: glycosyltransferase family 2 protein [Bacteroidales bacterium]
MPTYNRPAFIPRAIRYFLNQDYPNKELLIVDDSTESVSGLIPDHHQIRYIRLEQKTKLGAKRNYCVEESRGDLILHWDDDDWMAPYRISYQVNELLKNKAEVCGLQQMLFYHLERRTGWLYRYPKNQRSWLAGGSLLYTKDFWEKSPFPDIQQASDTKFIWSRKLESFVVLDNYRFYIAMIHDQNTSPKNTGNGLWKPYPIQEIKSIISDDWDFYSTIGKAVIKPQKTAIKTILSYHTPKPVSACLLSYKRPHNIQPIINSIHDFPFIDEIIVWNNNTELIPDFHGEKVKVINSRENVLCYGRFLCINEAKNEIVYVQDDDVIVHNVESLYRHFLNDESTLTHALSDRHLRQYRNYIYPDGEVALLGWGSFFRKEWTGILDVFLKSHNPDFIFKREADIIFSLLLGKKHNTLPAKIQELAEHSSKGIALYLEKDHELFRALAINRALGFLRKSKNQNAPVTWNIVITCRNYGKFIEEAVSSVLRNKADYVITIVDDCSTDNTREISTILAKTYSPINYIRLRLNKGVSYARNKGIASVESKFVVLLDADDKIGPTYLFEAEKLLTSGWDVANPDAILFGKTNTRWTVPQKVTLQMLLKRNFVHCAAAFRRKFWAEVGGIDESMANWQDYDFWIRVAAEGAGITRIAGNHFYYRKHGYSKSSRSAEKSNELRSFIREKHEHLYRENQVDMALNV